MFDTQIFEDEKRIKELQAIADKLKAQYDNVIRELRQLVYKIERT